MKKEFLNEKTIVIFTGGPGTGKSGTADRFLQFLNNRTIVKISYDGIKEKNWENFGFDNENQKERLNLWSLEEFYLTIQKEMRGGNTIFIEYPFYQIHKQKLKDLIRENEYLAVTIYLYTDLETMYERGVKRDKEDSRHPGHFFSEYHSETYPSKILVRKSRKPLSCEEFMASISQKNYNIKLGLDIEIDVTDFGAIHYEEIYERIMEYQRGRELPRI